MDFTSDNNKYVSVPNKYHINFDISKFSCGWFVAVNTRQTLNNDTTKFWFIVSMY